MRFYFFAISNNKIDYIEPGARYPAFEYQQLEGLPGEEDIYYKLTDGKVSHIICEAKDQNAAYKVVEQYLLSL